MSFVKSGISAAGRLLIVVALLGAFLAGLIGVVVFSLRGGEVLVPELVGKDFSQSEKDLVALGLKIKKRATRYSQQAPNTVLEQSPKPGETVKTGLPVFVTISRSYTEGDEVPIETDTNTNTEKPADDDNAPVNTALTKKDKPKKDPKKANTNANTGDKGNASGNSAGTGDNKNSGSGGNNSNDSKPPANNSNKNNNNRTSPANTGKPVAAKTPAPTGDGRPRRTP